MSNVSFHIDALRAAAANRPDGYLEDCLATGTIDGERVMFTREQYGELCRKYRGQVPAKAQPTPPPSLAQRVANFAASAAKHVASGMPMCTDEQIQARWAICQGCEFHQNGTCMKCGCPLVRERHYISKLSWANEKCPVGKWGPVVPS